MNKYVVSSIKVLNAYKYINRRLVQKTLDKRGFIFKDNEFLTVSTCFRRDIFKSHNLDFYEIIGDDEIFLIHLKFSPFSPSRNMPSWEKNDFELFFRNNKEELLKKDDDEHSIGHIHGIVLKYDEEEGKNFYFGMLDNIMEIYNELA